MLKMRRILYWYCVFSGIILGMGVLYVFVVLAFPFSFKSLQRSSVQDRIAYQLGIYQLTEGPGNRGIAFEEVISWLSSDVSLLASFSESEVIHLFGAPDFASINEQGPRMLAYTYSRGKPQDRLAVVFIDEGRVTRIGQNAKLSVDLSLFKPYEKDGAGKETMKINAAELE